MSSSIVSTKPLLSFRDFNHNNTLYKFDCMIAEASRLPAYFYYSKLIPIFIIDECHMITHSRFLYPRRTEMFEWVRNPGNGL